MPSTFSPLLGIELIASGEQSNTWGYTTNNNLGTLIEQAIAGQADIVMTTLSHTLTDTDGASDEARCMIINVSGVLASAGTVICPTSTKVYVVANNTSGSQEIEFKTSAGLGVIVPPDTSKVVFCDGTDVYEAVTAVEALLLGGDPTDDLMAVPRQYVDNNFLGLGGGTLSGPLVLPGAPSTSLQATTKNYVDSNFVELAGDTMTGPLILSGAPTTNLQAATKLYVDQVATGAATGLVPDTRLVSTGTGLTGGGDLSADRTLSLATSGVTAGSYANPTIVVDAYGRVTSATPGSGSAVTSVNAKTGAVVLIPSDIGAPTTGGSGATGTWGISITGNAATVTSVTSLQVTTALGYSPVSVSGTGATGTWGISITGTAATASALASGANLSTPSSGNLASCTGYNASNLSGYVLPANGGTGTTSLGTGISTWLTSPTSTNLRAAVTDETGSGSLVFGTSPTIATPSFTGAVSSTGDISAPNFRQTGATGAFAFSASGVGIYYDGSKVNFLNGSSSSGSWNASGFGTVNLVNTGTAYRGGTTTWDATSDAILKENITSVAPQDSLAVINQLNPVSFDWKYANDAASIGFIAQEFEQVLPLNVSSIKASSITDGPSVLTPEQEYIKENLDPNYDIKTLGFKTDFYAHLVGAIQALSAEVEALKAKVG